MKGLGAQSEESPGNNASPGRKDPGPRRKDQGRPRLLFISYFFPPARTIACVRAHAMAKWLVRAGWEVTVITPQTSVWRSTDAAGEIDQGIAG